MNKARRQPNTIRVLFSQPSLENTYADLWQIKEPLYKTGVEN